VEGSGRAGLLVLPFAAGSMLTASNSYRLSRRFGRTAVLAGIGAMLAGQALIAVVLRLSGDSPDFWALTGPPLLAGLGNGLVIAPIRTSPRPRCRAQAGTAGGALITAQRLGAAIGIAVIGTALFGSGSGGGNGSGSTAGKAMPALVHSAQTATLVNLCFIALACAFGLPARLAGQNQEPEADIARPGRCLARRLRVAAPGHGRPAEHGEA
jgi:hypothetical protein